MFQWDSWWFTGIAQNGYSAKSTAFYPLYPLLIRAVSEVLRISLAAAAVLVSTVCFFLGLYFLLKLLLLDLERPRAVRGMLLLADRIVFTPLWQAWRAREAEVQRLQVEVGRASALAGQEDEVVYGHRRDIRGQLNHDVPLFRLDRRRVLLTRVDYRLRCCELLLVALLAQGCKIPRSW